MIKLYTVIEFFFYHVYFLNFNLCNDEYLEMIKNYTIKAVPDVGISCILGKNSPRMDLNMD